MIKKRKNKVIKLMLIVVIVVVKIQFFPFSFTELTLNRNTSIYTYKVDSKIHNKYDFIDFLKSNKEEYELDRFMDSYGNVNWDNVIKSTKVYRLGWKKVYSLDYSTLDPECNKYKIDMTYDGYIKNYRSAGK